MKYVKVVNLTNTDPGNPLLLSFLRTHDSLNFLFLKKYGSSPELFVEKSNSELINTMGMETGEEIFHSGNGLKLSVKGDHRLIELPERNIGDRIFELLDNEDTGFVKLRIRRHYFNDFSKKVDVMYKDNKKLKLREGWKVDIETDNPQVRSYIAHLFSGKNIRVLFRKWRPNAPTVAWWEIVYFIPTRLVTRHESGIKIGATKKSGPIYIDFNKDFHTLIIGSTGSGKSTLVYNIINNILSSNNGKVILIDPHGETAYKLSLTSEEFFQLSGESARGINILNNYNGKNVNYRMAEDFISILKSTREMQFSESFIGPRIEDLISRGIVAISKVKGATIVDLYNIFKSKEARNKIKKVSDDAELTVFLDEIENLPREELLGTERALGRLALDPFIRSLICNPDDDGTLEKEIEKNNLILFNLDRGLFGYEDSRLLSNIFAVYLWFIISSRRDNNYYLFLEEAQDYQSTFISDMISSGRKFGLRLFFITTSFKGISSNLEALFFSNISNYIVLKLSEPDKMNFKQFIGFDVDFPNEYLKFTLISSNIQTRGYTDRVFFEPHRSEFIASNYSFLTDINLEEEVIKKISDIMSTFESRRNIFFIYETFANYLINYEKSVVISAVKKIIKNNPKIHYVGRFNFNTSIISGRFEVFEYIGSGNIGESVPKVFEDTSKFIENVISTK